MQYMMQSIFSLSKWFDPLPRESNMLRFKVRPLRKIYLKSYTKMLTPSFFSVVKKYISGPMQVLWLLLA